MGFSSHINPGRIAIALIATGAMLALLSSAAFATGTPGAPPSLGASPGASATAMARPTAMVTSPPKGAEASETTTPTATASGSASACVVGNDVFVGGVDKDVNIKPSSDDKSTTSVDKDLKSAERDKDDPTTAGATPTAAPTASAITGTLPACKNVSTDRDDSTASPSASAKSDPDHQGDVSSGGNGDDRSRSNSDDQGDSNR